MNSGDGLDGRLDVWWVVTLTGVLLVVLFVAVTRQTVASRRAPVASAASGTGSVPTTDLGSPHAPDAEDTEAATPEGTSAERDRGGESPAMIIEPRRAPSEEEPLGSDSALASLDSGRMLGERPRIASGPVQMPLPRTAADDAEHVVAEVQPPAAAEPVEVEEPADEPAGEAEELEAEPAAVGEPEAEPAAVEEPEAEPAAVEEPQAEPAGEAEEPGAEPEVRGGNSAPADGA